MTASIAFPVPPPRARAALLAALLGGCTVDAQIGERPRGTTPEGVPLLDVLFVIDDSASMLEEQEALAVHFPRFIDRLATLPSGLPDLQIGVVSTDMGLDGSSGSCGFESPACLDEGGGGVLRNEPRDESCAPIADRFLVSHAVPGGRDENFTGTLGEAFACIAQLGARGCGIEQPLEAMRRALDGSNAENDGFLREDAFLAVVIISDEDDCSAADCAVFDPSQADMTDPLGPFGSFRCTEFGILCGGTTIARAAGEYAACEPRGDSYLHHPQRYLDFLRGLKRDPSQIVVTVIAGNPSPIRVGTNMMGHPELTPSCANALGSAAPAVRLSWLAHELGDRGAFRSICDEDVGDALDLIGTSVRDAIDTWDPPEQDPAYTSGCAAAGGRGSFTPAMILVVLLLVARRRAPR